MSQATVTENADNTSGVSMMIKRATIDIAFHFFATITLLAVTAPSVSSWQALGAVGLIGLIIDGTRHVASPECRATPLGIWRQVEGGIADTAQFKSKLRFWRRMITFSMVIWLSYTILFVLLVSPDESKLAPTWFALAKPFALICSNLSNICRQAAPQLIQHGYPNRAEFVSFFFVSSTFYFALCGAVLFSGYTLTLSMKTLSNRRERGFSTSGSSTLFAWALGSFVVALLAYFVVLDWVRLSWHGPQDTSKDALFDSNMGLFHYYLGQSGFFAFIMASYQIILTARCMLRGLDNVGPLPEQEQPRNPPSKS
jgi:hypothetical protein